VKYILTSPNINTNSPKLNLVYNGEVKIYENNDAFPRIFFVPGYEYFSDKKTVFEVLGRYTVQDFKEKVLLEAPPPFYLRAQSSLSSVRQKSKIDITLYQPNKIDFNISSDLDGFCVISDNFHPAWKAEIDGEQTETLKANYIMRAVPIKKGFHNIKLFFRPKFLIISSMITPIGWSILILLIGIIWLSKNIKTRKNG
jgi:uncharacterized membrane protein YfhO